MIRKTVTLKHPSGQLTTINYCVEWKSKSTSDGDTIRVLKEGWFYSGTNIEVKNSLSFLIDDADEGDTFDDFTVIKIENFE